MLNTLRWRNGDWLSEHDTLPQSSEPGGVFTSLRTHEQQLLWWPAHRERLITNAAAAKLPLSETRLDEGAAALRAACAKEGGCFRIRVVVRKNSLSFEGTPVTLAPAHVGWTVQTLPFERPSPQLKYTTPDYVRHTPPAGVDELLYTDQQGNIREGRITNVFWVQAGRLITPPLTHALPGVMREQIQKAATTLGIPLEEADLLIPKAEAAEGFVSNAIQGIRWICSLNGQAWARGDVTKALQQQFKEIWPE